MKTAFASLLFALTLGTSSASFAQDQPDPSPASFQTKLYALEGVGIVDVVVANPDAKRLTVRLLDERGVTMASQPLTQTKAATRTRFDISDLRDGVYHVEVSDGSNKQTEEINLTTSAPVVSSRKITVG